MPYGLNGERPGMYLDKDEGSNGGSQKKNEQTEEIELDPIKMKSSEELYSYWTERYITFLTNSANRVESEQFDAGGALTELESSKPEIRSAVNKFKEDLNNFCETEGIFALTENLEIADKDVLNQKVEKFHSFFIQRYNELIDTISSCLSGLSIVRMNDTLVDVNKDVVDLYKTNLASNRQIRKIREDDEEFSGASDKICYNIGHNLGNMVPGIPTRSFDATIEEARKETEEIYKGNLGGMLIKHNFVDVSFHSLRFLFNLSGNFETIARHAKAIPELKKDPEKLRELFNSIPSLGNNVIYIVPESYDQVRNSRDEISNKFGEFSFIS
ncbi:MAG: hypothetical protein WCG48_00400 [Candidatus Berkelbacteria bacterium]